MVRYTVNIVPEVGAVVRVFATEHNHDTRRLTRHVALWCREFIREVWFARGSPSPREVHREVKAEALRRALELAHDTEPDLTAEELKCRWRKTDTESQNGCREFFITRKQVRDELRAWERDSNELKDDEAESINQWVTTNPEKVLMYRPGTETEPGVPEKVSGLGPLVVQAPPRVSPLTRSAPRFRSTRTGSLLLGRTRLGAIS